MSYESVDIAKLLYSKPDLDFSGIFIHDPEQFNAAAKEFFSDYTALSPMANGLHWNDVFTEEQVHEFHDKRSNTWYMPDEYKQLDIAQWVLEQCSGDAELQRAGEELLLYQQLELFDLLRFCKYFVDTLRQNNVVWGLGRGSSVSSFVLFLIGIHKINSLYYGLDIVDFLKVKNTEINT